MRRGSRVSRSCKKNKKNKGQDVNQIPGTSSCSERVARTHPHNFSMGIDLLLGPDPTSTKMKPN